MPPKNGATEASSVTRPNGRRAEIPRPSSSRSRLPYLRGRVGRSVTSGAVFRSGLVEKHRLISDHFCQLVALGAAHILMGAPERKCSPFIVVKQRRFPLRRSVALAAMGYISLTKLLAVNILVTVFALCRSGFEVHVEQLGLQIRRLVAIHAGRYPMRAEQREFCLRVVKAREFFPRFRGVTSLAAGR